MNNWNFTGNLGQDAETRFLTNGDPVVNFSVGVKSGYGDKATTTWAKCAMFGKRAEAVSAYLVKGQLVGVSGEVSLREWEKKEGGKGYTLEVRVNDLTLLGKSDKAKESAPSGKPQRTQQPADDFDESLPF